MAIVNGYTDLDSLKKRLYSANPNMVEDPTDDVALENVIEAVSRFIDSPLGLNRVFYATTATRYFTPRTNMRVVIDDLLSVTTLKTDFDGDGTYETTWATTDYRLNPMNKTPKIEIQKTPFGVNYFPTIDGEGVEASVQVVGSFGYCAIADRPETITEACILGAMRVWGRKDLTFGISGSAELGSQQAVVALKNDSEFMSMLKSVAKRLIY